MTETEVIRHVNIWLMEIGLLEYKDKFRKGTLVTRGWQRDDGFKYVDQLSEEEEENLRHEITHLWDHSFGTVLSCCVVCWSDALLYIWWRMSADCLVILGSAIV
jgi:hypothetical protein